MEERYIASVDLGTSRIALTIARVNGDDVQIVYYRETPSQGIRNSYVFNPKKVETELRQAVIQAQQELKIKILQVIVGLPRYFVRQETASATTERTDQDSQIQEGEIKVLKSMALESYPLTDSNNEVIYGAVAQSFSTEESFNELENDIVGMTGAKLEGNFKVFIGNRRHSINIDNVFNSLGLAITKKYFTPGITARAVLKNEQMENGVALIDLGAGVSSVTLFKGKIMRFYAAIPFGGNSITNDIKSECGISFDLAENIKKAYGACMPNKLATLGDKVIQINDENDVPTTQVAVKYLSEIITARMKEIIEAMLFLIQQSGYASEEELRAGVVVTGGGANLINCANLIKELSGYSVKIGFARPFFSCEGCASAKDTGATTSMGMILAAKGDRLLNCVNLPPTCKASVAGAGVKTDTTSITSASGVAEPGPERSDAALRQTEAPATEPDEPDRRGQEAIEPSVAAAQEDADLTDTVFDPAPENIGIPKADKRPKKPKFVWLKHFQDKISNSVGNMFDQMKEDINHEEV